MKNIWLAVIFGIGCVLFSTLIVAARSDASERQTIVDLCLVGLGLVTVILGAISIFDKDKERWWALLFVGLLALACSVIAFIGVVAVVPRFLPIFEAERNGGD
jgi:MFS family permease